MRSVVHSDVLVIGAGSAGSVVAERLSSNPDCRVTVVETGPGPRDAAIRTLAEDAMQLPIGLRSPVVTRFETRLTEDPVRLAQLVRGATLGGSGAVNGGYFCRGVVDDYAEWGLPGWGADEVLRHFRAIETDLDFGGPRHGDSGPVKIHRTTEFSIGTAQFLDRCNERGVPWLPDLNSLEDRRLRTGVGAVPLNIVDGVRIGPGAAFLMPALDRPNLAVVTDCRVLRIQFRGTRAVGADLIVGHDVQTIHADRIVLCAGAIGSARLLMLSGVGSEQTLRALGVPVQQPAPVGTGCSDHPEWVMATGWPGESRRPVLEAVLSVADDLEVRPYTRGFWSMVGEVSPGGDDRPHLGVALMKPSSRARIRLVSADPTVPPLIEHRYDTSPDDVGRLAEGVEFVRDIIGATTDLGVPDWSTSQHLCGSAPMGGDGDGRAVLDERCRVRGVDGLWVIDGAALPTIPSRGPHATTVMLAHRAAEFVVDVP